MRSLTNDIVVGPYIVKRDRRYTRTDEWAKLSEGNIIIVGITDYAQKKLRDIVGVELPEKGRRVSRGEAIASVESVKAVADVYSPVTGVVIDVNESLYDEPERINRDPYGEGWMFTLKPEDLSEFNKLLTPEEYADHIRKREKI